MRLYALLFLIFIFLCSGVTASDKKQDINKEEEEIIRVLDMLENYDLLTNMDLYNDKEKTDDALTIKPDVEEKDKKGKQ